MKESQAEKDPVNHPPHYTQFPIECIEVTQYFNFCMGNAIKYIWRADSKKSPIQDMRKAIWYLEQEIKRRLEQREQSFEKYQKQIEQDLMEEYKNKHRDGCPSEHGGECTCEWHKKIIREEVINRESNV